MNKNNVFSQRIRNRSYRFNNAHYFGVSVAIGDAIKIVQVVLDTEEGCAAHGFGFDNFLGSIQRLLPTLAVGTCLFDVSVFLGAYGRLRRRNDCGYAFAISEVSGRCFRCIGLGLGFCKTLHRERPNTNGASNMAANVLLLLLLLLKE